MKAVFLDRDGVINRDPGKSRYVSSWSEFNFLPYSKKAIALLSSKNVPLFIISNQAGVSKGLYTVEMLEDITAKMLSRLTECKAKIRAVYYCIHNARDNCSCRKPKAGMIEKAVSGAKIDIAQSFFVGDTISDVQTAKAAGCKSILVLSGKEKLSSRLSWQAQPDFIFPNLYHAAKFIAGKV